MTTAKKVFTLLLIELLLLSSAFGGGFYLAYLKQREVEHQMVEASQKAAHAEEAWQKAILAAHTRAQLLEAALGVLHQNYGVASERVLRAQELGGRQGLLLGKDLEEATTLILQQRPEALGKLLLLADKVEPTAGSALNKLTPRPSAISATSTPTSAPPTTAASVATAPAEAPAAARLPAAASGLAADFLAGKPARETTSEFRDGREALRQAKVELLSGSEPSAIVKKLAQAQVLLEESGYAELDEDLSTAIKAAKSHDDSRLKTALDAALARLRTR